MTRQTENEIVYMTEEYFPEAGIQMKAVKLGKDIAVWIYGGNAPHVGAVSLWNPLEEKTDTLTYGTHKEFVVTERVATAVGEYTKAAVSVTAGIHYDSFSTEVLARVNKCVEEILVKCIELFDQHN